MRIRHLKDMLIAMNPEIGSIVDELKRMVAQDQLEPALEKIRSFTKSWDRVNDQDIKDIERIAIINQAKLTNLNKNQQTGQTDPNSAFVNGRGQVANVIVDLIEKIQSIDYSRINMQLKKMLSNDLDKVVKVLLVSVLLCSALYFIYSLFDFNMLKLSVSFVGGTGSFLGYFNWRTSELRYRN